MGGYRFIHVGLFLCIDHSVISKNTQAVSPALFNIQAAEQQSSGRITATATAGPERETDPVSPGGRHMASSWYYIERPKIQYMTIRFWPAQILKVQSGKTKG